MRSWLKEAETVLSLDLEFFAITERDGAPCAELVQMISIGQCHMSSDITDEETLFLLSYCVVRISNLKTKIL